MAFSANCFVIVSLLVLLQFLIVSASTKPIDTICFGVDKDYCIKTLSAYPPAVSASTVFQVTQAALRFAKSYTEKPIKLTEKAAKENPKLKKDFLTCQLSYKNIEKQLSMAALILKDKPVEALNRCDLLWNEMNNVKDTVGLNEDEASKTLVKMTLTMEKITAIVVRAIQCVSGGLKR